MTSLLRALDTVIRVGELLLVGLLVTWGLVVLTLKADSEPGKR